MGENEDRTLHNLKACRAITDESIETYHGRVFGSAGDSVIAEFASPVDAIVAAVSFRETCGTATMRWPRRTRCSSV